MKSLIFVLHSQCRFTCKAFLSLICLLLLLMLQISCRQPELASDVEDDEDEPQASTSTGVTHGSKPTSSSRPPPAKKAKATSAAGVADTLRDYLHAQDSEAKEVKAEVDIHAFGTEIA